MGTNRGKKTGTHMGRVRLVLWYLVVTLGAVIMLLPFAWMISTSFKAENEIFTVPIRWLPSRITLQNYVKALEVELRVIPISSRSFLISSSSSMQPSQPPQNPNP